MPRTTRSKVSRNRHYQIRKYLSRSESQEVAPSPQPIQQHVGVQVVDEEKNEMRNSLVVAANLITNLADEREQWQQQQQQWQQQQQQYQQEIGRLGEHCADLGRDVREKKGILEREREKHKNYVERSLRIERSGVEEMKKMREGFHEQREKGERLKKTVTRLGNENKDLRGKVRWQEDKIGDLEAELKGAGEEIGELGMKIDEMDMDICLKDREINELRGRLRAQWGENIRQF